MEFYVNVEVRKTKKTAESHLEKIFKEHEMIEKQLDARATYVKEREAELEKRETKFKGERLKFYSEKIREHEMIAKQLEARATNVEECEEELEKRETKFKEERLKFYTEKIQVLYISFNVIDYKLSLANDMPE